MAHVVYTCPFRGVMGSFNRTYQGCGRRGLESGLWAAVLLGLEAARVHDQYVEPPGNKNNNNLKVKAKRLLKYIDIIKREVLFWSLGQFRCYLNWFLAHQLFLWNKTFSRSQHFRLSEVNWTCIINCVSQIAVTSQLYPYTCPCIYVFLRQLEKVAAE